MDDHTVQLHHKYEKTGGDQYAVAWSEDTRRSGELWATNKWMHRKREKKATQLASYSCCNLCASTYCALYHPFQLLPFFSLFSAVLGYVQSIPQAALDFRPLVIFFFHLLTSIPTYLSSSCFCTFLSLWENLWYNKLVLFCAQKHLPYPEHVGASPISSRLQTSFSSFSFTYLPTYLPLVFTVFFMGKFVLQACAFWLVAWCTSMFHQYIHNKICLWIYLFLKFSFLLRDIESFLFYFLEAQTIDPTWQASHWQPPRQQAHWQRASKSFTCRLMGGFEPVVCV
jgi:hypothetical protein